MKIVKIDKPKKVKIKRKGNFYEIGDVIHPCGDENFFAVLSEADKDGFYDVMWSDGNIRQTKVHNCHNLGYMGIHYKIDFELKKQESK